MRSLTTPLGAFMSERDTGECDQEHKQGSDGATIDRSRSHVRPSVVMAVVKIGLRFTPCTPSCRQMRDRLNALGLLDEEARA